MEQISLTLSVSILQEYSPVLVCLIPENGLNYPYKTCYCLIVAFEQTSSQNSFIPPRTSLRSPLLIAKSYAPLLTVSQKKIFSRFKSCGTKKWDFTTWVGILSLALDWEWKDNWKWEWDFDLNKTTEMGIVQNLDWEMGLRLPDCQVVTRGYGMMNWQP